MSALIIAKNNIGKFTTDLRGAITPSNSKEIATALKSNGVALIQMPKVTFKASLAIVNHVRPRSYGPNKPKRVFVKGPTFGQWLRFLTLPGIGALKLCYDEGNRLK